MDEVKQPLTGKELIQKTRENNHLSRREVAELCGYYEITETNEIRVRLTNYYDALMTATKEAEISPPPIIYSLKTTLDQERVVSKTKLIKELRMSCGDVSTINVSTPPQISQSYSNDDINAYFDQGFVWHPNFIGFQIRNDIGGCWVKIYVSNRLELEADTQRAIVVPYYVSEENYFYLSGDYKSERVDLKSGQYQLLYQNRLLTDEEMKSLGDTFDYFFDPEFYDPEIDDDESRPELCILTFIPTTEDIEPQILRREPGFNPPEKLIMFPELMPLP